MRPIAQSVVGSLSNTALRSLAALLTGRDQVRLRVINGGKSERASVFETTVGSRFSEGTVPRIADALEQITKSRARSIEHGDIILVRHEENTE